MRIATLIVATAASLLIPSSAMSHPVHASASVSFDVPDDIEWYDADNDDDFVVADRVCRWVRMPSGRWTLTWRLISYDDFFDRWFFVGPWEVEYSLHISRPYWGYVAFCPACNSFYCNHPGSDDYYIHRYHRPAVRISVNHFVRHPFAYHSRDYYRDRHWRTGKIAYRHYSRTPQPVQKYTYTPQRPQLQKTVITRPVTTVRKTVETVERPRTTTTVTRESRPAQKTTQNDGTIRRVR